MDPLCTLPNENPSLKQILCGFQGLQNVPALLYYSRKHKKRNKSSNSNYINPELNKMMFELGLIKMLQIAY